MIYPFSRKKDESYKDIGAGIDYVKDDPGGMFSAVRWLVGLVTALLSPRRPK